MYRFHLLLLLSLLLVVLPTAYGQDDCCVCGPIMLDGKKAYDNEYWSVAKAKFRLAADICKCSSSCTLNGLTAEEWIAKCNKKLKSSAAYTEYVNRVAFTMVPIAGGTYQMGDVMGDDTANPEGSDETIHTATVKPFYLGQTEVTQALYRAVMGSNPSHFANCDECPVELVSWEDAQLFVQKLNDLTRKVSVSSAGVSEAADSLSVGLQGAEDSLLVGAPVRAARIYRLPTEAEWEYAAREGGKKVRFGNGKDTLNPALVNFNGYESYQKPYSIVGQYREKTTPAKSFSSNVLGLYDMSGNVYEWCQDGYGAYPSSSGAAYTGPASSPYRVSRGGGWSSDPRSCRAASRTSYLANTRTSRIGIRLCCSAQ